MSFRSEFVVDCKVVYCGNPNWWYIGDDPVSGKPVLRNAITGQFIVADTNKITKPVDHKNELLCDVEPYMDRVATNGLDFPYHRGVLKGLSSHLIRIGYGDGSPNSDYVVLGIITETRHKLIRIGTYISRSDFEISVADALHNANIRKNKIVVAS